MEDARLLSQRYVSTGSSLGLHFHPEPGESYSLVKEMGRLVTPQTLLIILLFFSHLNSGACAGFALANGDWLGRTIAFYQVFFQQGRVALGK